MRHALSGVGQVIAKNKGVFVIELVDASILPSLIIFSFYHYLYIARLHWTRGPWLNIP